MYLEFLYQYKIKNTLKSIKLVIMILGYIIYDFFVTLKNKS